jgi:hypothetical protein
MLEAGITPVDPYPGRTDLPWLCRCRCQRDVVERLTWVRAGSIGCVVRAPRGRQRVADEQAEAELRAASWEPLGPYPSSQTLWLSHCRPCGAEGSHTLNNIRAAPRRHGCRPCAWATVDRRLPQQEAISLMQSAGMDPLAEYMGRTRWGCRWCAIRGIDYTAPFLVYLITHDQLGARKIGICNVVNRARRLTAHAEEGWQVVHTLNTPTGDHAHRVEQQVLAELAARGIGPYLAIEIMPQGGYTETVDAEAIDAPDLWQLIVGSETVMRPSP